jgi:hypothetical protein
MRRITPGVSSRLEPEVNSFAVIGFGDHSTLKRNSLSFATAFEERRGKYDRRDESG